MSSSPRAGDIARLALTKRLSRAGHRKASLPRRHRPFHGATCPVTGHRGTLDGLVEAVEADQRRRVLPLGGPAFAGAGREVDQPDVPGAKLVESLLRRFPAPGPARRGNSSGTGGPRRRRSGRSSRSERSARSSDLRSAFARTGRRWASPNPSPSGSRTACGWTRPGWGRRRNIPRAHPGPSAAMARRGQCSSVVVASADRRSGRRGHRARFGYVRHSY